MKIINKLFITIIAILVFSCDLTNLEFQQDPNNASPAQADINSLYNNIQLEFENFYSTANFLGGGLGRMVARQGGFTYNDTFSPTSYNNIWFRAYATLLPDIEALSAVAIESELDIHLGTAMILKSYVLTTLVDIFGDVPYTEAQQGTDIISPSRDTGSSVYAAALTILDDAIAILSGTESAKPANDFFYDGDPDKWITLANTLKLRIYNNTRLVDANAGSLMSAIIAAGDIIDNSSEDFEFKFGTNRVLPNSRHPFYNDGYETNDGDYQSNYFMWLLYSEKRQVAGTPLTPKDPRIRFYFYRQETNIATVDANAFSCEIADLPDEITGDDNRPEYYTAVDVDMPFCIVSLDGYYGRDHLNGSGIPPDGPIRTIYGLYPGGGTFDDSSDEFQQKAGTTGALGKGIWPIMHSSYVYFIRAEAAQAGITGENPRALLEQGIRASISKVRSFESEIDKSKVVGSDPSTGDDITLEEAYLDNLDDDTEDYVTNVLNMYDNPNNYISAGDQMDVIMKEYLIALYGNGHETYNNLRRTQRPLNVQPGIDGATGTYLWSAWYPADHVNLNANAEQKANVNGMVFWAQGVDPNSVK